MRRAPRSKRAISAICLLLSVAVVTQPIALRAQEVSETTLAEAREHFTKGAALAKATQWAEALTSFERSAALRPHAVTTYNIASCLRAMGRYTRARAALLQALEQDKAGGGEQLSASLKEETNGWLVEIESLLATMDLEISPAGSSIAVDGRPLELVKMPDGKSQLLAGTRPPGPPEATPAGRFTFRIDPGTHVLTITHAGYSERVLSQTVTSSSTNTLKLSLDTMPGTLRISASQEGSVVSVNDLDVGVAPVELSRPAGSYKVLVRKPGFLPFKTDINVRAGEKSTVLAALREDKPALYERWWFWGAVLGGGIAIGTVTYFAARPAPERPPPNGGTLGWVVSPLTFH